MKNAIFLTFLLPLAVLSACSTTQPQNEIPEGMHLMNGKLMKNSDMMMDNDDLKMDCAGSGCSTGDSCPGCAGNMADGASCMGADGTCNCPCCQGMKGMMGMNHDDMTMGDMVEMLKGKTGDELDAAFLEGMIPHHQGALDMAQFLLKDAKHPELQALGKPSSSHSKRRSTR